MRAEMAIPRPARPRATAPPSLRAVGTRVEARLPGGLEVSEADADQLQQVFLNLFLNARDAMPNGGDLYISAKRLSGGVEVIVADSGPGMDAEAAKRAFDPFYTTKPAGKGTGLGLPVCYGIITAHGGTIDYETTESGGAGFRITLPSADVK